MPPNHADFNEKLKQAVEHDRLINRLESLREDFERYSRDAKERGDKQDEAIEHLERGMQTTVRRIDAVVIKVTIYAAIFGALGGTVLEYIMYKMLGGPK